MKAGSGSTDSSLLHSLQNLESKLELLYNLLQEVWRVLEHVDVSGDEHGDSDEGELAELE